MNANKDLYLNQNCTYDFFLLSPDFDIALRECSVNGGYSCIWTMYALTTVLRRNIESVYPTINGQSDLAAKIANTILIPLSKEDLVISLEPIFIMWTRAAPMLDSTIPWTPNHFVPLLAAAPAECIADSESHHVSNPQEEISTSLFEHIISDNEIATDEEIMVDNEVAPADEIVSEGPSDEIVSEDPTNEIVSEAPTDEIVSDKVIIPYNEIAPNASEGPRVVEAHKGGIRIILDGYCYVRNRSTDEKTYV